MDLFKLQREGFVAGDTHPAINGIKIFLNRHYAISKSDLILNSSIDIATQTALRDYQSYKGLSVTGNADRATLESIGAEMTVLEFDLATQFEPKIWNLLTGVNQSECSCGNTVSRMSDCEKALSKLFTHKDSGIIFVDTNDDDDFDPITNSNRKEHDHIYNDPKILDIQTPTNFYIPAGGKVLAHFGWHGARKRINTQQHKLNKHKDEIWENQEITIVFYEKIGKLRKVVFQIWHLDPFLNQVQPDGSILLGQMGKDGLMRYGDKMGDPDGFHIHINFYRQWWKGASTLYSPSNRSILFPPNPKSVRVPLSALCTSGEIIL